MYKTFRSSYTFVHQEGRRRRKKNFFFRLERFRGRLCSHAIIRLHSLNTVCHRQTERKVASITKKKSKKTFLFSSSFIVYIYRGKFLYVKLFSRNHFSTCRVISQGNVRPPQLTPLQSEKKKISQGKTHVSLSDLKMCIHIQPGNG